MSGQAFIQFIGFFAANIAVASLISYIIEGGAAAWQLGNRSEKLDG